MTGSEFNAEYKLGQRIASGSVESFLAHGTPTRRLVMVHRLTGVNDGERRRINYLIDALPTKATTVLARVDVDDIQVVVTEFLPDFVNLRDWLEAAVATQTTVVIRTGAASSPPPTAPIVTPAPTSAGGEFTQLFGAPVTPPAATPPTATPAFTPREAATPPAPAAPPTPKIAPPAVASNDTSGSFTALFGAAPHPAPSATPAAPSPTTPPPPPPPVSPPPAPPRAAAPPSSPAPAQPAGSFTELFGTPLMPSDAPAPPAPTPPPPVVAHPSAPVAPTPQASAPPPASPPKKQGPGDFTQMFGGTASPPVDPLGSSPPSSPGPIQSPRYAPPSPPPYAPPPQPTNAASTPGGANEAPKIRVSWRPRETPPASPPGGPASATGAMRPAAPPPPPAFDHPPPPSGPSFAPPNVPATVPPFAAPGPTPSYNAPSAPPPFGSFGGPPPMSGPPSPSRGSDASMGPPELRLYSNDAGERVEPYAPAPVPSSAPVPRASGPSDFTRILTPVEAPPSAPPPPAMKPAPKPEAAGGGRKPSALPLIIVLNVAAIVALGLILYFVLRPK